MSHPPQSRWLRAAPGALALFVACLCVIAQVSVAAHFLLVRHAVCPEHGELVHAHDAEHSSAQHDSSEEGVGRAVEVDDSEQDDHAHDHCVVRSQRLDSLVAPRVSHTITAARVVVPCEPVLVVLPPVVPTPRTLLLLIAPKSSPPASA